MRAKLFFVALLGAWTCTSFGFQLTSYYPIKTGVHSGGSSSQIGFEHFFSKDASEGDMYINDLQFVAGSNWDTNITFDLQNSSLQYFDFNTNTNNLYTLGSAISGNQMWFMDRPWSHFGNIDSAVANGVYDFTLDWIGGDSSSSTDVLASIDLQLEVFDSIDIEVTGEAIPNVISAGQTTQVKMSVKNLMSGRDYVSTTWFFTNGGMMNGSNSLQFLEFNGNWFDQHIAPGDTRTDDHTKWMANASTPLGTYTGGMGVVGGLHNGDEYFVSMSGTIPTVQVIVPEPGTMAVLALGAAALLRRRSRK